MTKKIILGGILAGVVLFIWSAIAHMALPIGEMGLKTLQNEDAVLAALKPIINEPGLYIFPAADMMRSRSLPADQQQAAVDAWTRKLEAGPTGLMVYNPGSGAPMSMRQLGLEFLSDLIGGLIVAFALAMAALRVRTFGARVGFVTLLGVLAWVLVDFSYWNWFGFPSAYEVAQFLDQVVGMALAGVALALLFRGD